MAKFKSFEVYNAIIAQGLVPVFYNGDFEIAKNVLKAVAKGGSNLFEFTNRGDFAYEIFVKLVRAFEKEEPQMVIGAGSIVDPYTAAIYVNNGANFIVGPVLNLEVAKLCNRRRIPYSPGCGTASEISNAEEIGCEIVKVFPGDALGGPDFVKSILGPMPWTKIMPTGGVEITEESIKRWFESGVVAVGIGSNLITKELIAKKDWIGITKNVEKALALIKKYKK